MVVGPHPDEMPLLNLKPLHPMHDFQHSIDLFRAGWKRAVARVLCAKHLPWLAYDLRPGIEVALNTNRWQATRGNDCFVETRCDVLDRP